MKKILSILLALCLLVLSVPFAASAETAKPAAPAIEILNGPSSEAGNWRVGDSIQWRLRFDWPAADESKGEGWGADEIRLQVFFNGEMTDQWWHGWWQDEESQQYYSNDNWSDINHYGTMKLVGFINWHHWYWVDENDNVDEWIESEITSQEFQIAKPAGLGKIDIYPQTEPQEGKPLRLGFTIPRTPEWEDPSFRTDNDWFISPYVQYTVTNKKTGKREDIAPRKVEYHEAAMGWWQWWDDQAQQEVYAYGTNATVTDQLDKGTYVVKARAVDKRGNHDAGEWVTAEFTIGDPASGVNITMDKDIYELGDKASIVIDAEDARSFNLHIYAPDGKGDINKVVKAKNGSYKYTTDVLNNQEDIRVEVYQVDGIDLENIAYATIPVYGSVKITPDKKEYDVGDTAKFTLSAFEATSFIVETVIQHADGTRESRFNEKVPATNGQAVYELEMEEPQTVFLRVVADSFDHWYDEARCTVDVLDEDEKPISLKAPKNLTVKKNADGKIALAWKAVTNAQSYIVYRRSGDDDYEEIANNVVDTAFVDKTAKAGVLYYYRVSAFAKNKAEDEFESPTSVEKSFILLSATKKLTVKTAGSKAFTATWKAVTGAGAYEVYYSTSKKAPKTSTRAQETTSDLKLTVSNLKAGKTYYVYVRAIRNLDNGTTIYGPWSTAATVKVTKALKK